MKKFDQTSKGKRAKETKKPEDLTRGNTTREQEWVNSEEDEEEEKIKSARDALKNRVGRSQTVKTPKKVGN